MYIVVGGFELGWWDAADLMVDAMGVEPVDVAEQGELHALQAIPGLAQVQQFSLEHSDCRFSQGVVVGITRSADRGEGTYFAETFSVADRGVLAATIRVMHQALKTLLASPDGLLKGVQRQVGMQAARHLPAHDHTAEHIDYQRHIDEP